MQTIRPTNTEPERLDIVVAGLLGMSRSKAQKAIKDGAVIVDGTPATPHMAVTAENAIAYAPDAFAAPAAPAGSMPVLDVVYEDDDMVVVNKPAGVLAHPTPESHELTLADALTARYPGMKTAGDQELRAGLVHRLDRDASGVVVAAKTKEAFALLKRQFAERRTVKRYTVLVLGNLTDDTGTIRFPIARSVSGGRMAARPLSQEGREAVTHYTVQERFGHATLLDVDIATGRTHQIRAHFFALQHPVVGDTLYVQKGLKQIDIGRLFLHARALTVTLPNGEEQTFTAPLPQALEDVLTRLRTTGKKHV